MFVADYVIAHEVAHLVEMNHSAAFWRVVAGLCPAYKKAELWLKKIRLIYTVSPAAKRINCYVKENAGFNSCFLFGLRFFPGTCFIGRAKRKLEKVSVLAGQNNNVNVSEAGGMTPLMLLVERGNWDELNAVVSRAETKDIFQALEELSLLKQSPEYLALNALLAAGADVNAADARGRTALIIAAQKGNVIAVSVLLKNNADPSIRDMYHYAALSYAENQEIIRLLIQAEERGN